MFVMRMKRSCNIFVALVMLLVTMNAGAAEKEVLLPYGDMNRWTIRKIHESSIIGGKTKTLYEVGPNRTIEGNKPYVNGGGSP